MKLSEVMNRHSLVGSNLSPTLLTFLVTATRKSKEIQGGMRMKELGMQLFKVFIIIAFIMAFIDLTGTFIEGVLTFLAWSAFILGMIVTFLDNKLKNEVIDMEKEMFKNLIEDLQNKYQEINITGKWDVKRGAGLILTQRKNKYNQPPVIFRNCTVMINDNNEFEFYNNYGESVVIDEMIQESIEMLKQDILKKAKKE